LTSRPFDLLLSVSRDDARTLGAQIEDRLRAGIRAGTLKPGTRLPSTRDLAGQLGVSRPIVLDAYEQLAAEGYLTLRQGAAPRVADVAGPGAAGPPDVAPAVPLPRYDFRPSVPDLSLFPRTAWLRSMRRVLATMPDAELDYGDPAGAQPLRAALADYLGRVRGVVAEPVHVVITSGYAQTRLLVCRALAAAGATRVAIEDPSHPEQRAAIADAGLDLIPIGVDEHGLRVEELERAQVDAVIVTPAHQFPSGAVLSGERRNALLAWLRARGATAVEDDYDAEYRYDRAPIGALQGLDPGRVVYAGTASKTLAPALRLGWLVVPDGLLEAVTHHKRIADLGGPRIDQHAFADFLGRGELDRHLRRMRTRYRARRDTLVDTLEKALPDAEIQGIAAGLHVAVRLHDGDDERAILDEAQRRRIALTAMGYYRIRPGPPGLLLGYAQTPEPSIRAGAAELADAIQATRRRR
jgi:GntR family transcriptional regulator / MocR family aminotransferase